jgi:hypothetical protein
VEPQRPLDRRRPFPIEYKRELAALRLGVHTVDVSAAESEAGADPSSGLDANASVPSLGRALGHLVDKGAVRLPASR